MRRYFPFVIVGVVAVITLVSATVLYRATRPPVLTIPQNRSAAETKDADSTHVLGRPDAPVTLEEFGDFQCPPCGRLSDPINQLERDYSSRLRLVFRHFPLGMHVHASEAAWAAEAAGLQGRFWEMHDLLYREQDVWSKASDVRVLFSSYAGMLGLNVDRFKKDMESDDVKARVALDRSRAAAIGVSNTPTIFINNQAVDTKSMSPDGLRAAVDAALKNVKPPS